MPINAAEVACKEPQGLLLLPWNGLWQSIWFSPNCAHMEEFFLKTRCRNSVNLFKMRVRKLEENIKSYPRGNFFLLSSWTIFFFVLNGIFWQERLSKCAFVCVNGHKRECGSMLFAQREREMEDRFHFASPQCLRTICLVLTWQHDC